MSKIDLSNTEVAFSLKSNKDLKKTYRLFRLMSYPWLVSIGSFLTVWALRLHIPFVKAIVKRTIFNQFVGGETLVDCQSTIDTLYCKQVLTVLDYGAEQKSREEDFDKTMTELLKALDFAATNNSTPVIVVKLSGLTNRTLLEKISDDRPLNVKEQHNHENFLKRIDTICNRARKRSVAVFIDAEESWLQDAIDAISLDMISRYNRKRIIVYSTYQMYCKGMLEKLKRDHRRGQKQGYILGAKIVRGAYMEKENERAEKRGYETPINPDKETTDRMYNDAIVYCAENYETIASCCATHNKESALIYARMIEKLDVANNHLHLNFAQLYGMSDHISFNLAPHGYNVAKYVPYGRVKEVVPYLIRRAQENTSVTGDMSRELRIINRELKRRGMVG